MFNSATIDVAIGLSFIFLLFSLLVSATCEMLAGFFKWRAANLWDGVEHLLQSEEARDALYSHPLIRGLAPGPVPGARSGAAAPASTGAVWSALPKRLVGALRLSQDANASHIPSYIPARSFALALIDVVRDPHAIEKKILDGLDSLIDAARTDPIGFAQSLNAKLQTLATDPDVSQDGRQQIADLRARICAVPDANRVAALKGSVEQAIAAVPPANEGSVSAVKAWLAAPAAANWPELRSALAAAVAQVTTPDQAIQTVRAALDNVLNGLTVGSNDQILRELEAFIDRSQDLRHALDNADAKLNGLTGALAPLLDEAAGDIDRFRRNVEIWFDDGMDRVAGSYKRYTTAWQAAIGFVLAVALNVDALLIVRTLYRDPALRQSLASQAQAYSNAPVSTVERRGIEFTSSTATAGGAPLTVSLSAAELQHGDTLTAMVSLPTINATAVVRVDGQSANLTFACTTTEAFASTKECPANGQQSIPVLARVTDLKNESLETFKVSVPASEPGSAAPSVIVNVVARPTAATEFDSLRAEINTLGLPIGWRTCQDKSDLQMQPLWCGDPNWWSWDTVLGLSSMLLGWLVTAAAMSLGAPFWFDILKRFVSIRAAGKAPEESPLKPKEQPEPLAAGEPEIKETAGK
jgi:hypothetical protein